MIEFDADAARRVEAAYSTPDIVAQRDRVRDALALEPGEQVLDVGVGPGFLAAEMAAEVGPDGRVCGVDTSEAMLEVAARRNPGVHAATLELELGSAEQIPHADESFDAVVTTQVLEYVPDVAAALAEMRRVLRPGGRLLVLDTDWDSLVWHAPDEELMARVLAIWDEHLVDPHLPRSLGRSLREAGFVAGPPTVLPLLNVGDPHDSFSGFLLGLVAAFVVRNGFTSEEVDAWAESMRALGEDWFFSLNRYVFVASRP